MHSLVRLEDSVSQIPGSKDSPEDMSSFFRGFASLLGFQEGNQQVSFPATLFPLVAKEVEGRLAT